MDREVMTNEENYCFDVAGYLHVPGTLTRPEVERLNREIDAMGATEGMLGWPGKAREPFRDLLVHPALVWYLNQLVGQGFILDRAPEVWCEETCDTSAPLVGGNEPRDPAIAYYFQNGRRFSEGVRVLWALEDVEE
ncbi:MAG: hypothetical protein F4Z85_09845, partial [Gemmatimonadetes bacterium]|nr:hypothetical protein [Gemmatimonadota bacterium]